MDKLAQKRRLRDVIKDKTNFRGMVAEKFFEPELLRVMDKLRKTDNDIRSIALGKRVENGDPGEDSESLKNLLKNSKTNFARREYITGISFIGRFHKKMFEIAKFCESFGMNVSIIHNQFLFKGVKQDHLDQVKDLHQKRWAEINYTMVKVASIFDTFHNITSTRGRALALWEKRYEKQIGKLRDRSVDILEKSDNIYTYLLSCLDQMGTFRAERDIDSYEELMKSLLIEVKKYDGQFRVYYTENVKPFVDNAKLFDQKEQIENPAPTPILTPKPEPEPDPFPSPVAPVADQGSSQLPLNFNSEPNKVRVDPQLGTNFDKVRIANMLNMLESMSEEDPLILASYIKKCSKLIQDKNPEQAIRLLNIVKKIKG